MAGATAAGPRRTGGGAAVGAAVEACIGLGGNLGDRRAQLAAARAGLAAWPGVRVVAASALWETAAIGPPQGDYLNAALRVETALGARELLEACQALERRAGRERGGVRNGPRILDLDLLLYADRCVAEPGLCVPHPRLHERAFVLEPLAEVAGDWLHPRLGVTIASLAGASRDRRLARPLAGGGEETWRSSQ